LEAGWGDLERLQDKTPETQLITAIFDHSLIHETIIDSLAKGDS
jgi:hypothetical protein